MLFLQHYFIFYKKMAIIEIKNLTKILKKKKIFANVNLAINQGEIMVIMGRSGSGKTTLLRLLTGMTKVDEGNIFIKNKDITQIDQDEFNVLRKETGMLFQSSALFNSMTVGENIALPLREHTNFDDEMIDVIIKMKLEMVGLSGVEDLKPIELSGGMKKRVGLARALALDPKIVFYDEPGAGLDPIASTLIDKLIVDLSKKLGITSIVVTHDMHSAFRIADRITMLHNGKIQQIGSVQEIKQTTNSIVKQFITGGVECVGHTK
jgi:phospholipid/cholesterol/gamma-HCH transport system ATP-binding protein